MPSASHCLYVHFNDFFLKGKKSSPQSEMRSTQLISDGETVNFNAWFFNHATARGGLEFSD